MTVAQSTVLMWSAHRLTERAVIERSFHRASPPLLNFNGDLKIFSFTIGPLWATGGFATDRIRTF